MNRQIFVSFMPRYSSLSILFLIFEFSCAAQKSSKSYHEDLSVNRPKFVNVEDSVRRKQQKDSIVVPPKPTRNVNAKVDAVLDSIDQFNLTKRFVDGFTLQVYSGQKREDAMNAKTKVNTETELSANLQYIQPKFRVTIGSYFSKLEAQKDLMRLKRIFPNTILVPEKIQIR
jgi:SPOR domain